jgi:hypothetical protein
VPPRAVRGLYERHARESGHPFAFARLQSKMVPAFAGMTSTGMGINRFAKTIVYRGFFR